METSFTLSILKKDYYPPVPECELLGKVLITLSGDQKLIELIKERLEQMDSDFIFGKII
jgi:hypothetical protein